MKFSVNNVSVIVFVVVITWFSVVTSEDEIGDQLTNRVTRGFGASANLPFSSDFNDDLTDWNAVWGSPTKKRQMSSVVSGLGSFGGQGRDQYQNWNDYFARPYRAFGPRQRSNGLGSKGGFGQDGLQNWRAFFDHYNGRRFRK